MTSPGRPTRWIHVEYDGEAKYAAGDAVRLLREKRREDRIRADPSTVTVLRAIDADLRHDAVPDVPTRVARAWPSDARLRTTPIVALRPAPLRPSATRPRRP